MEFKVKISRNKIIALVFVLSVLTSLFFGVQIGAQSGFPATTITSGPYAGAPTYTVYSNGTHYFAKNAYGAISWTSTNLVAVETSVRDALLAAGGTIVLNGVEWLQSIDLASNIGVTQIYGGVTTFLGNLAASPAKTLEMINTLPTTKQTVISNFSSTVGWTLAGTGATVAVNTTSGGWVEGGSALTLSSGAAAVQASIGRVVSLDLTNCSYLLFFVNPLASTYSTFGGLSIQMRTTDTSWTHYFKWDISNRLTTRGAGWYTNILNFSAASAYGSANWSLVNDIELIMYTTGGGVTSVSFDYLAMSYDQYQPMVMFRMDDSLIDAYTIAYPVLHKYGYSAVESLIISLVGVSGYLTEEQVKELDGDRWDIISHTYNSSLPLTAMSMQQIDFQLYKSQQALLNMGITRGARFITTPNGDSNATVDVEIQKYYLAAFAFGRAGWMEYPLATFNATTLNATYYGKQGGNRMLTDRYHLTSMDVFNTTSGLSRNNPNSWLNAATINGWVDQAIASNTLLVIDWHASNATILDQVCAYIHLKGVRVVTLSDLFDNDARLPKRLVTYGSTANATATTFSVIVNTVSTPTYFNPQFDSATLAIADFKYLGVTYSWALGVCTATVTVSGTGLPASMNCIWNAKCEPDW